MALRCVHDLEKPVLAGHQARLLHQVDCHRQRDHARERHPAGQWTARLPHGRFGLLFGAAELDDILAHAALSTMAVTPWPPAVQTEISARLPGSVAKSFAVSPNMRAPVAANGCP